MPMNVSLNSDKYIIEQLSMTVGEVIYKSWIDGWTPALRAEQKFLEDILRDYPPTTIAIIKRQAMDYASNKYSLYKSIDYEIKMKRTVIWISLVVLTAVFTCMIVFM